jgi:carbonic anhydrase
LTVARLRQSEPILAHLAEQGHLTIIGAVYDLHSGQIAPIGD